MIKVVFHADDFGICEPVTEGIINAFSGIVTAASIMAPCAGFEHAVRCYSQHSDILDIGLHFTLTTGGISQPYSPLSPDVPTLVDKQGFFNINLEKVAASLSSQDIEKELRTQMHHATKSGIRITHIDSHMFVGNHPKVAEAMAKVAWDFRVPVVLTKKHTMEKKLIQMGFPIFNSIVAVQSLQQLKIHLSSLKGGLHYVIFHPAIRTPTLEKLLPNTWERRVDDYNICTEGIISELINQLNVHPVGMRQLMNELRNSYKWI